MMVITCNPFRTLNVSITPQPDWLPSLARINPVRARLKFYVQKLHQTKPKIRSRMRDLTCHSSFTKDKYGRNSLWKKQENIRASKWGQTAEQGGGNGGGREKVHQWAQDTELPLQLQVSFHWVFGTNSGWLWASLQNLENWSNLIF